VRLAFSQETVAEILAASGEMFSMHLCDLPGSPRCDALVRLSADASVRPRFQRRYAWSPRMIAYVALFLASDEISFVKWREYHR
jgi:hypothetical protein